ncbi:hypothetical protein ABFV55_27465, partial [Pseudomonas syringae]|uniref:hypothetical protein n=1 Tax=Pseudomonas syringae TaxID=317 RepID=UPI0034D97BFC
VKLLRVTEEQTKEIAHLIKENDEVRETSRQRGYKITSLERSNKLLETYIQDNMNEQLHLEWQNNMLQKELMRLYDKDSREDELEKENRRLKERIRILEEESQEPPI